jgi:predicted Zn-dependent protease with MMP-like domain
VLVRGDAPLARSRAEQFDELVAASVEHLHERWSAELEPVRWAVEDVPPASESEPPVVLAHASAGDEQEPPTVVLYRRPIEMRALDRLDLADLVHDVVVEQVAQLLGLDPETVDPYYGED